MNSRKRTCADSLQAMTRGLVWYYRRATWRSRYLPDFIVIGAQRSGTSSLFAYLAQHPQLMPSYRKEVHFFDGGLDHRVDTYQKGPAWYRAHFPRQRAGATRKAFEASPFYMPHPLVPQRIARLMPDVKLIAILRNPTERAISHYFFSRELGHEPLSITDALREEEQRIAPVLRNQDYLSEAFIYHSYKHRGRYREQLERFRQHFPWDRILVLASEELFGDPATSLRRVFSFVGVDPDFRVKDLQARNVARNRSQVQASVYESLDEYFQPHNQALYALMGKGFDW